MFLLCGIVLALALGVAPSLRVPSRPYFPRTLFDFPFWPRLGYFFARSLACRPSRFNTVLKLERLFCFFHRVGDGVYFPFATLQMLFCGKNVSRKFCARSCDATHALSATTSRPRRRCTAPPDEICFQKQMAARPISHLFHDARVVASDASPSR